MNAKELRKLTEETVAALHKERQLAELEAQDKLNRLIKKKLPDAQKFFNDIFLVDAKKASSTGVMWPEVAYSTKDHDYHLLLALERVCKDLEYSTSWTFDKNDDFFIYIQPVRLLKIAW